MNQQLRPPLTPAVTEASPGDAADGSFYGVGDPGALEAFFSGETKPAPAARRSTRVPIGGGGEVALIEAYRARGYLRARLDPLGLAPLPDAPELNPAQYGLHTTAVQPLVDRLRRT